jgi:hypothetical protein
MKQPTTETGSITMPTQPSTGRIRTQSHGNLPTPNGGGKGANVPRTSSDTNYATATGPVKKY